VDFVRDRESMGCSLRVLQIHNRYRESGGEDAVVDAEAELLRSSGHELLQYQAQNPAGWMRSAGSLALAVWNPRAARNLMQTVEEFGPDIAHVHNTWYSLSPAVVHALHRASIPVVMTLHNYRLMCANGQLYRDGSPCEDCVGTHPWRGVVHRCYRGSTVASAMAAATIGVHRLLDTWSDVELFLAPTAFARALLITSGLPEDKIAVKPHFVEDPGPREHPPSEGTEVLYVGRLSDGKGVDRLLDAWHAAPHRSMELVIIGDGPLRSQLESGATSGVTFLGRLPHEGVLERMRRARALLFPSTTYETFGLVMIEAMACGVPVFASDLGPVAEVLDPLHDVQLVSPGRSTAGWVDTIAGLQDAALVDDIGRHGRTSYLQRYQPSVALAVLERALLSAIGV
jgi:glycosyltransferase involved in cell wall biosynthesis